MQFDGTIFLCWRKGFWLRYPGKRFYNQPLALLYFLMPATQDKPRTAQKKLTFRKKDMQQIAKAIEQAKSIAIISHRNPDGDTTGAGLGLRDVLKRQGRFVQNVCIDPIPSSFRFLPDVTQYTQDFNPKEFDLTIAVDAAARHQTGLNELKPELFTGKFPFANIDHHISNELFGTMNLVESDACSTTAVLWKFCDRMDWQISPQAATCLLNGLMTDTGSLQHSNATPEALRIAAKLLAAGADLAAITKFVFRTTSIPTLRLWGRILERIEKNSQQIVSSIVYDRDFAVTGANPKDASGAIDFLNMVPDARYAMLLSERDGKVKGSLRTSLDEVNVSDIAAQFGGGGHVKAAGFSVPGQLQVERRFRIIKELPQMAGAETQKHQSQKSSSKAAA